MSYINIDVDIDEIISCLTNKEKQELVDDLYDDGYIAKKSDEAKSTDDEWNEQIGKLFNNKWRLSPEDEATILAITNKIVS